MSLEDSKVEVIPQEKKEGIINEEMTVKMSLQLAEFYLKTIDKIWLQKFIIELESWDSSNIINDTVNILFQDISRLIMSEFNILKTENEEKNITIMKSILNNIISQKKETLKFFENLKEEFWIRSNEVNYIIWNQLNIFSKIRRQ